MTERSDAATLAVAERDPAADQRSTLVERLLEQYRLTGTLPLIAGGDHDGDEDGDDDNTDDDESQADESNDDDDNDDEESDDDDSDDDDDDAPLTKKQARKLRSEARNLRNRLKDANGEIERLKGAQGDPNPDLERRATDAETRAEEAERKYRGLIVENAVIAEATKAGARSPRAVMALIRDEIEIDDDGELTGVAAAVKALQESEPDLFKFAEGRADGGAGDDEDADDGTLQGRSRIAKAYNTSGRKRKRK